MSLDHLALRTARTFVDSYAHEDEALGQQAVPLVRTASTSGPGGNEQALAADRRDCEAFLQLGIDAFKWVIRADQVTRQAIYDGTADFDQDAVEAALRDLCKLWLKACGRAEQWAANQQSRKLPVANLEEFRSCCDEMRAIVKAQEQGDEEELPDGLTSVLEKAIEEHRGGQTTEFV